ncbi:ema, partial [Symbiodinium sp. KB8]
MPIKVRAQCIFVPCTAGEDDAIVAVKQQQAVPSQWEQWVGSVVGWFTNVLHVGGPKDQIVLSLEEFTQLRDHLLRMQGYIKEAEDRAEQAEALLVLTRRRHKQDVKDPSSIPADPPRSSSAATAARYGQPHREIGEAFAQPFVDRRIRDRLRDLLFTQHPHLQAQVLQTIHILLAATPPSCIGRAEAGELSESEALRNEVVTANFDFRQNEDLLPLWITVVKDIATMMSEENLMLFFNPYSEKPFPFFSQSAKYYHHPSAQVRTHVQATSLEIFSKLKIADSWSNSLFELVVADSKILFTHVPSLGSMADETIRSTIWRDMKNAFSLQNDILEYINDVFASAKASVDVALLNYLASYRLADPATKDVNQLSAILQERLLRFAVLPVLLGSALQAQQQPLLTQEASWYLLGDLLSTLRGLSNLVVSKLKTLMMRTVIRLVVSPPPNTPDAYFHLQKPLGKKRRGPGEDHHSGATLHDPQPAREGGSQRGLDSRDGLWPQVRTFALSHEEITLALDLRLRELCRSGRTQEAVCAFSTLEMSLQALRSAGEPLDLSVAERLGNCLASCLARQGSLSFVLCLSCLRALSELFAAGGSKVRQSLSPMLRDKLLAPFADELLHAKLQCLDIQAQGSWLQDFQQQWHTSAQDLSALSEKPRSQILPEPGAAPEASAALPARAKSSGNLWRLLLSLHRLVAGKGTMEMPGLEEGERDELLRYQPGVAVLVGKMNRVKCTVQGLLLEALNAEPVIAEPLRLVVLHTGDENAKAPGRFWGNTEEPSLRMKVFAPRSPALRKLAGWSSTELSQHACI